MSAPLEAAFLAMLILIPLVGIVWALGMVIQSHYNIPEDGLMLILGFVLLVGCGLSLKIVGLW